MDKDQGVMIAGIVALGVVALLMLVFLTNVDAIRAGAFRAGVEATCANPAQVCAQSGSMFNFTNKSTEGFAWENTTPTTRT